MDIGKGNISVSFAVTCCNETTEIQKLLPFLLEHKRPQDEIVILFDSKNGSRGVEDYLRSKSAPSFPGFNWISAEFTGHFADWKNKLTKHCSGDFIFQIDADELPSETLIKILPDILETNPQVEVYLVPRINTVEGLTEQHIQQWNWKVENERVNFPDYQWRIYRRLSTISWANKVHERLTGYNNYAFLPAQDEYCLYHPKTIERQVKQNNYYDTL